MSGKILGKSAALAELIFLSEYYGPTACDPEAKRIVDAAINEHESLQRRVEELETSESELIEERDSLEAVIDSICDLVLGEGRREWTSAYGYADAINDVDEKIFAADKRVEELEKALRETRYPTMPDTLRVDMEFNGLHITRTATITEIESGNIDIVALSASRMWKELKQTLSTTTDSAAVKKCDECGQEKGQKEGVYCVSCGRVNNA